MSRLRAVSVLLFVCLAAAVQAAVDVKPLAPIVVLERGRKKPLDTYARTTLLAFSGKRRVEGLSALEWIAEVLFGGNTASARRVFLVDNPEIADELGIERRRRRYSFDDIRPAIGTLSQRGAQVQRKPAQERSAFENELLRLHDNVFEYSRLASGLAYLDPHPMLRISDSVALQYLGLVGGATPGYWDLLAGTDALTEHVERLQLDTSGIPWNASDSAVVRVAMMMFRLQSGAGNPPPHMVPTATQTGEQWFGPWGYVAKFGSEARACGPLLELHALRRAWHDGNQEAFDAAAEAFVRAVAGSEHVEVPRTSLEVLYNQLNPMGYARALLGVALVLALVGLAATARVCFRLGALCAGAGMVLLSVALGMRMAIMGRPPVTNLYETFVFVAWACAVLGLVLEWIQRNGVGLLVAAGGGFAFVHIAARFGLDGDTMGMLAAVLNNNFWLATHIMTIAPGYAGCAAAAAIAHVYLAKRCLNASESSCEPLDRAAYGMLLFGLTFTVAGTVLGGLWADQSWGRFWGWDPKENGALLIVLWCSAVIHARRGTMIGAVGTAVGSIVLFVLVLFAWLGVNLLGVGMHSYGFTTRGATVLFGVAGGELLLLAIASGLLWFRRARAHE